MAEIIFIFVNLSRNRRSSHNPRVNVFIFQIH